MKLLFKNRVFNSACLLAELLYWNPTIRIKSYYYIDYLTDHLNLHLEKAD